MIRKRVKVIYSHIFMYISTFFFDRKKKWKIYIKMFANKKKRVDVYVALRILPNRIDTHYSTNAMNMYFVESPNMLQIL